MLKDKLKVFFVDWYNGIFFISMGIVICTVIYINKDNQQFISILQKTLTYDFAIFLLGVCVIACGIQVLVLPISKQLYKNEKIRRWFIEQQAKIQAKKWRKGHV